MLWKVTRPFSTKKITQPLRTKKSCNLFVKQKITQPLGGKNVLKNQILVTIKLQEIGTGHLGLVYCTNFYFTLLYSVSISQQTNMGYKIRQTRLVYHHSLYWSPCVPIKCYSLTEHTQSTWWTCDTAPTGAPLEFLIWYFC